MGYTRSTIVNQAKAWIGLKESDNSHQEIIDIYNAHTPLARSYKVKYTDAWCATFVSAVSIKCGYTAIIPTECSCSKMITLFKNLDEWEEDDSYTPGAGDIIFYDWQDTTGTTSDNTGTPDHVGIVEKVSGTTITVIEGNYSDSVKRRTIKVNAKYIRGYGVPKYTGTSSSSGSSSSSSSSSSTSTTSTTSSSSTSTSSSSSKTTTTSSSKPSYTVGKTYTTQVELNVRKGAGTNYAKVGYSGLTADGKKHDSDKDGAIDKGTTVTCKSKKTVGSDIWIKIPSGWIAAYYSGKVYVK